MEASGQELISAARLLSAPSHVVFEYLKGGHDSPNALDGFISIGETAELALLDRDEPIVDLAIALYGWSQDAGRRIYRATTARDDTFRQAIRVGLMMNQRRGRHCFRIEQMLQCDTEREATVRLASATNPELEAFFRNPTTPIDYLTRFLEGKVLWKDLLPSLRTQALIDLAYNVNITSEYEGFNGGASYSQSKLISALWNFLLRTPVEEISALSLTNLYSRCVRPTKFDWDAALARLRRDSEEEAFATSSPKDQLFLGSYQELRSVIAQRRIESHSADFDLYFSSEDIALRVGAYRADCYPSLENMMKAVDCDHVHAYFAYLQNERVWQTEERRAYLSAVDRIITKEPDWEGRRTLERDMQTRMRSEHPEWFNVKQDPADAVATVKDVNITLQRADESLAKVMQVNLQNSNAIIESTVNCTVVAIVAVTIVVAIAVSVLLWLR